MCVNYLGKEESKNNSMDKNLFTSEFLRVHSTNPAQLWAERIAKDEKENHYFA
jgi:hypothetical protein